MGTNDYGSFSGNFTAPRDRLMGRMMIRTDGIQGNTWVNVEEYKRPKFQVTLDAPKTAARLGGEVLLDGKAMAYTGAAVGGAKVRYHVVRQVRYPDWWYWCFCWRMPQSGSQEIAHGTAETGADGIFKIKFIAKPDLSVAEKDEPVFQYAGLGRRDRHQRRNPLRRAHGAGRLHGPAGVACRQRLADVRQAGRDHADHDHARRRAAEGRRRTEDLPPQAAGKGRPAGHPRPAAGPPSCRARQHRAGPERRAGREDRRKRRSPRPMPRIPTPGNWAKSSPSKGSRPTPTGHATWSTKLDAGAYRAKFETQDRFGKKIVALLPLNVLAPEAKTFPIKIPNLVAGPKWSLEPGEEFMALWGSGYDRARAFIEIEHRGKLLQSFWTEAGATQQPVKQAVTEAMRGGFTLHVTMVRENRGYLESRHVDVPWTNKDLTREMGAFRLQAGARSEGDLDRRD